MPLFLLGSDHAGFRLKEHLRRTLAARGIAFEDFSPDVVEGDDYVPVAERVAKHLSPTNDVMGILVCGSGFGMAIAANRFREARAVVIRTSEEARLAREHNHANILVLGEHFTSSRQAEQILTAWIDAHPSYSARHVRRIHQLSRVCS